MAPRLRVSDNQRFLVCEDGRPLFYLGDTAWELFHRLDREEADLYLEDRAALRSIASMNLRDLLSIVEPPPDHNV